MIDSFADKLLWGLSDLASYFYRGGHKTAERAAFFLYALVLSALAAMYPVFYRD